MRESSSNDDMKNQFLQLFSNYSNQKQYALECWQEIEQHYSSFGRYYHTLEHLEMMFTELKSVQYLIHDVHAIRYSIYYHDIVYNPLKKNNEEKSALVLEKRLSKTSFSRIKASMAQIQATSHHNHSSDADTNYLLDLDLSILGKPADVYQQYTKNIRKEYFMYPDFLFRKGRRKVLNYFLNKPFIFKTDEFKGRYESQARVNLQIEFNSLV